MVFNLFGLQKPQNNRSVTEILKETMSPLRIDAAHFCLEGQFTDDCYKRLVQKVKNTAKLYDDIDETVLQTQLSLANQAYERGSVKGTIELDHPLLQFVWGLALMRIVSNPKQMESWPKENQSENGIINSAIWEQIKATPFMKTKLNEVTVMLASRGFVHQDMSIRWGGAPYPQGVGYYFSPTENLVNLDLLWHLIGGSEHMVAVVFHELAHASGTVAFSPASERLREELIKKTNCDEIMDQADNLTEQEKIEQLTKRLQEAELLNLEMEIRHMWFDEAENSFASGFCKVLTEKNLYHQDLAYDINAFETAIVAGWGFVKDTEPYKSLITPEMKQQEQIQRTQQEPMAEFLNFKKVLRYAFYVNNGLFENKRELWEKIGVNYDWLIGKDKEGKIIKGQEVIDDIINLSAQIEAQQIPTNVYSRRVSIRTKIEEACRERGKLADESFERYITPLLEKMLKERQQQQSQQQNQMQQQMQDAMQQMQQQSQMTPQQRREQQNQSGQSQNGQSGSKDEQSQNGQSGSKDEQSQNGQNGSKDEQSQNGQNGSKDEQSQNAQNGSKNEQSQNSQSGSKDEQSQNSQNGSKDEQSQNGQNGSNENKQNQGRQEGQNKEQKQGQNGNNPIQKLFPRISNSPAEKRCSKQQTKDSDKGKNVQEVINQSMEEQQNASAQERSLKEGVKELIQTTQRSHVEPPVYTRERHVYNQIISKHVSLLRKLKELFAQLRNEYYSERDKVRRELLPEGSVQRSLDVRSVINRVQKRHTQQEMSINDYRHFNNPVNPTVKKAPIDICIFVDTSGSAQDANKAEFGIELGCIINEAVKNNDAFNVYLGIMTNPVQYIVEPGMSEKEIADRLGSIYARSYHGCSDDKIADATRTTLERIHQNTNTNEKEGFSHFFYITDGGHTDAPTCVPMLTQLMSESKITTFNWIKFSSYWGSRYTALDQIKEAGAGKIGSAMPLVVDIETNEDILPAFSKMLQIRIRDMKRSPALDMPVKKRMLKDSLTKLKANKDLDRNF